MSSLGAFHPWIRLLSGIVFPLLFLFFDFFELNSLNLTVLKVGIGIKGVWVGIHRIQLIAGLILIRLNCIASDICKGMWRGYCISIERY